MILKFTPPAYDGGSQITAYELYINDGDPLTEPTTLVTTYDGSSMTHTLTDTADSLTAGKIYKFIYRAINA